MPKMPNFEYEQKYWEQGICLVAGVDEAGMGAWAGPVIAAAVVFDSSNFQFLIFPAAVGLGCGRRNFQSISNDQILKSRLPVIRDSKTLSAAQREKAFAWIRLNCLAWGIGEASVEEISKLNIRGASHLAMRRAIGVMKVKPEILLIDGTPVQIHDQIPAVNVISGDSKSLSIAAASILAKVHRDRTMVKLDEKYPGYGLAQHKGYGTAEHKAALVRLGVTVHHRPTYAPVAEMLTK